MNEIHFDCPKCQRPMSGDKTLANEMITCPDCAEVFIPAVRKTTPSPEPSTPKAAAPCPVVLLSARKIRERAEDLAKLAALFFGVGIAILLFCVVGTIIANNGHIPYGGFIMGGVVISSACWLYLVAQIIHIRANTEK